MSGKSYRGQVFVPTKSAEQLQVESQEQAQLDQPDAVPLGTWFVLRGHRDPVKQAAMRAYTTVLRATPAEFDRIFMAF